MNFRPRHEFSQHAIDSLNVESIRDLIEGQAHLHTTSFNGSVPNLKQHFYQDQIRASQNQSSRMLNGIMATWDFKPIAYLMYYPAFDQKGRFGYYGEDIYVDEQARHHGIGLQLLSHFAKAALKDQACYLEWVTDLRNANFRRFMKRRMHAEPLPKLNLDASLLIEGLPFSNDIDKKLITRPINKSDGNNLSKLGVNAQLADHSIDMPCVGFITLNKDKNTPVAVTVANFRYSTFNTQWGLVLEPTVYARGIKGDAKEKVMKSLMIGVNEYCTSSKGSDLEVHSVNMYVSCSDKESVRLSYKKFHFTYDKIVEDRRSKMAPHAIDKDGLKRLASLDLNSGSAKQPVKAYTVEEPLRGSRTAFKFG